MTMNELLLSLLAPICDSAWAVELPHSPTWPAVVFDVDTQPEQGWSWGTGYDVHTSSLLVLGPDLDAITALATQIRDACEADPQCMGVESHGDADYEADPQIYGKFITVVFRLRHDTA